MKLVVTSRRLLVSLLIVVLALTVGCSAPSSTASTGAAPAAAAGPVNTNPQARVAPATGKLPNEISVDEAKTKRDAGAFILDVREQNEWDEYHVPGSTLIPLKQLPQRLNELPKDREIVVVCRSGNRSQEGRDVLKRSGFSSVTSMASGLLKWRANGYPTVTGR